MSFVILAVGGLVAGVRLWRTGGVRAAAVRLGEALAAVVAIVIVPLALLFWSSSGAVEDTLTRSRAELALYGAHVRDYLVPDSGNEVFRTIFGDARWTGFGRPGGERSQFLGYVTLGLAAVGLVWAVRMRGRLSPRLAVVVWSAVPLMLVLAWFSLASPTYWAGVRIPTPSSVVFDVAPFLRVYARFAVAGDGGADLRGGHRPGRGDPRAAAGGGGRDGGRDRGERARVAARRRCAGALGPARPPWTAGRPRTCRCGPGCATRRPRTRSCGISPPSRTRARALPHVRPTRPRADDRQRGPAARRHRHRHDVDRSGPVDAGRGGAPQPPRGQPGDHRPGAVRPGRPAGARSLPAPGGVRGRAGLPRRQRRLARHRAARRRDLIFHAPPGSRPSGSAAGSGGSCATPRR